MKPSPALLARARAFAADDISADDRQVVLDLCEAATTDEAAAADLASRFAGPLTFGTAGLRAPMGAGESRLNRAIVVRAAHAVGQWVAAGGGGPIVIGWDARHHSAQFALDTARVISSIPGCEALLLPEALPTPVLAYAVRHCGARAGIMVTASHNPAADNGYKVYDARGSQIVPPADTEIAALIERAPPARQIELGEGYARLDHEVHHAYVGDVAETLTGPGQPAEPDPLAWVYTPLHGVGAATMDLLRRAAGLPAPHLVIAQADPDPEFPTVAFPNPEEPGAMDAALALAAEVRADLVIAHDPDADRCAVAAPDLAGWRVLRGDEVGLLLAWWTVQRARQTGQPLAAPAQFASSIVSSSALAAFAHAEGIGWQGTLTGFKWVARVPHLAYGYEEALGYCMTPALVGDKDGLGAAIAMLSLTAELRSHGRCLDDVLDDIAARIGVHETRQASLRFPTAAAAQAAVAARVAAPPTSIAGLPVLGVDNLAEGVDGLPPTTGLRLWLLGPPTESPRVRVIVRPSGTEPKAKCYVEVVLPPAAPLGPARAAASARADAVMAAMTEALA